MNEYETNPQRHEASPHGEPSHRTADAPRDDTNPERGQSDYPTASWQAPAEPARPGQPAEPANPTGPANPANPERPAYSAPAVHPEQGAYQGQPPYPGLAGYPDQSTYPGYPEQAYPGRPGYSYPGQAGWDGGPGVPPHPDAATHQQPAWAQPVGGHPQTPRSGRARKAVVTGAAAVLLALGAGGVGAFSALAFNDDNTLNTTRTGNSSATRVVDRSSLAEIASAVQDSVVSITTGSGEGSGVVMSPDGFILTNNHVVSSAARGGTVKVIFANGKTANATVTGTDPRTDLAVIKATGVSDLQPAEFGKSAEMQVGDTVLALGSPLGLEGSVTAGIISAKDRTIRAGGEEQQSPFGQQQQAGPTSMSGLLQTDAPINPGNSGGALVNTNGQVIGINSAIATSGQNSGNIGLGFAIPSDKATKVAEQLKTGAKVSHPALGVSVAEIEGGGAAVKEVTPNSAAAKAGLEQGDVITQVNGKPINDSDDLISVVQSGSVGDTVQVTFTRGGAPRTVNATLAEAP